jgi:hypothetical protein
MEKNARIAPVGNLGKPDIITFSSGTGVKHNQPYSTVAMRVEYIQWSLEDNITLTYLV